MATCTHATLVTDGGAHADSRELVHIDLSATRDRWRYRCPNGHASWEPTNSHCWCSACSRAAQQGADVDAEHYELLDVETDELIDWAVVDVSE